MNRAQLFAGKVLWRLRWEISNLIGLYLKSRLKHAGEDVFLYPGVSINAPETISIGNHTHLGENVHLRGGGAIVIGEWCQVANNSIIATGGHPIDGGLYYGRSTYGDVYIANNVWVGSGAIILPGVSIGENSVIAAGAVVTNNVPANTIVGGVPARTIGQVPIKDVQE